MEEDNKIHKIIKCILVLIVVAIIISICIITYRKFCVNNDENEAFINQSISSDEIRKRREEPEHEFLNNLCDLIEQVTLKNNDWTGLNLSKSFREKYNQKEGILQNVDFDIIDNIDTYANTYYSVVEVTVKKGKKKDIYKLDYVINEKGELDDVIIKEIYNYKDENGDEIEHESLMIEDNYNYIMNLIILARPKFRIWEDSFLNREKVAVTDNYISKYDINNGFLDDPYFVNNYIDMKSCDYNNRYVVMFAEYPDRTEKISIIFLIDDKLRLDDLKFSIDEVIEITGEEKVKREERFLNEYGYSYEERYNNTQPFINY